MIALCLATLTFYWRLFPMIRKLDQSGQIQPKNYSLVLGGLIAVFIVCFALAAVF
jgi:hypothetical protein